jgi:hypothetical protein
MFRRIIAFTLTAVLLLGSPIAVRPASAQGQGGGNNVTALAIPIGGVVRDAAGVVTGAFQGSAAITRFIVNDQGQLVALGTVTGTITNTAGAVVSSVAATFSQVIAPGAGAGSVACSILNLVLGPIHLDLLGLVIDTNTIIVNITAVPGAGNLLGNLLCGIVGLLDGGNLNRLAALLNDLLRALPL